MTAKKLRKIKTKNMKKYTYNIKTPAAETQAPDSTTAVESTSPSTGTQTPGSSSTPSQATASPSATATSTPVNTSACHPTPAATQPDHDTRWRGYTGDDADSDYVAPTRAVWDDDDTEIAGVESETTEVTIPAEAPSKKIKADNYEISKKNKLTITAPGTYVIQTESTETATDGLIRSRLCRRHRDRHDTFDLKRSESDFLQ